MSLHSPFPSGSLASRPPPPGQTAKNMHATFSVTFISVKCLPLSTPLPVGLPFCFTVLDCAGCRLEITNLEMSLIKMSLGEESVVDRDPDSCIWDWVTSQQHLCKPFPAVTQSAGARTNLQSLFTTQNNSCLRQVHKSLLTFYTQGNSLFLSFLFQSFTCDFIWSAYLSRSALPSILGCEMLLLYIILIPCTKRAARNWIIHAWQTKKSTDS